MMNVINQNKKNNTMVEPFAGSSNMASGNEAKPSWFHLLDGIISGNAEGFFLIM